MRIASLILMFTLYSSCSIHQKKIPQKEISLEKTQCFGTCPIYTINIFSDGTGIYEGKKFVDLEGTYNFKVHKKKLRKIRRMANQINFKKIENKYFNELIRDAPSTIIFINNNLVKYNETPNEDILRINEYIYKISLESINQDH